MDEARIEKLPAFAAVQGDMAVLIAALANTLRGDVPARTVT